jgi:two-component system sensor histidine kinase VanS
MILIFVCMLVLGFLRLTMPSAYEDEITSRISENLMTLVEQLESTPHSKWEELLMAFCVTNRSGARINDANGSTVAGVNINFDGSVVNESEILAFERGIMNKGQSYTLTVSSGIEGAEQVSSVLSKMYLSLFIVIIVLSSVTALLYTRVLASPIVKISRVSKKMAELDMTWRCDIKRTDEIGILADSLNEMAAKLNTAMGDLHEANKKLQADIEKERLQDKQRGELFMAVSHELKTPLTIIKYDLDGMINGIGRYKDRDTYLLHAYKTADEMEQMIKTILLISQMESNEFEFDLAPVNLTLLIQRVLQLYCESVKAKSITVTEVYEKDLACNADAARLESAVSNIIGNAVYHSPEGADIFIGLKQEKEACILAVENTGANLSPEDTIQVFQPFFRSDKSRSRHTGGSGLGLYIAKTILDLHHFSYSLVNTDKGVKFIINFPIR